jgi:hypothetical protein
MSVASCVLLACAAKLWCLPYASSRTCTYGQFGVLFALCRHCCCMVTSGVRGQCTLQYFVGHVVATAFTCHVFTVIVLVAMSAVSLDGESGVCEKNDRSQTAPPQTVMYQPQSPNLNVDLRMLRYDGIGRFFSHAPDPPPKPTCTTNIDIRGRGGCYGNIHVGRFFRKHRSGSRAC